MAIVLDDVGSGYNLSSINANFQKIEDELNDNVLKREIEVGDANEMRTHLDMNNERGINCALAVDDTDIPNFAQVKAYGGEGDSESEAWAEVSRLYSLDSESSSVVSQAQVVLCQDEVVNATNAGAAQVVLAQAEVVNCQTEVTNCQDEVVNATNAGAAQVVLAEAEVVNCQAKVVLCQDEVDNCQDEVVLCQAKVVNCQTELSNCQDEVVACQDEVVLCVAEKNECNALAGTAGTFATDAALSATEANGYVSTSELEVIARNHSVVDSAVIYSTDVGANLSTVIYIYVPPTNTIYSLPDTMIGGETLVSVVGDVLTTNLTTHTLLNTDVKVRVKVITSTQTYETKPGCKSIKVIAVGAGGAGGGAEGNGAGVNSCGVGGGGGATVTKTISSLPVSFAVVIGAGGTGSTDVGTAGTATTFIGTGTSMSAGGGFGGAKGLSVDNSGSLGANGGLGSGGDLTIRGGQSTRTWITGAQVVEASNSGSSTLAPSSTSNGINSDGNNGFDQGGGGGGAQGYHDNATVRSGGDGGDGVCIIEEFY